MMRDAGDFWDRVQGGAAWNAWLAQLLGACRRGLGRALRHRAGLAFGR